jgi:type I restriction enzyme R subunit
VVQGSHSRRDKRSILRADYALFYKTGMALAVIEANVNAHSVGAGMQQAIGYAELLSVPFSFSSNGDGFVFRDATLASGTLETTIGLDEFPSPAELWDRYCAWKGWKAADSLSTRLSRTVPEAWQSRLETGRGLGRRVRALL